MTDTRPGLFSKSSAPGTALGVALHFRLNFGLSVWLNIREQETIR
jgi:hypothetical protein